MGDATWLPCPACGFLVFQNSYGSYDICDVCEWEDDAVQLGNPASGGANEPLSQYQERVLKRIPLEVRIQGDIQRSEKWRPLSQSELQEFAANEEYGQPYKFDSVSNETDAYWMRDR